jgi:hypothetical protein
MPLVNAAFHDEIARFIRHAIVGAREHFALVEEVFLCFGLVFSRIVDCVQ